MGALQSPRELEGREKTHFVFFCRFPNYFGQERYLSLPDEVLRALRVVVRGYSHAAKQ